MLLLTLVFILSGAAGLIYESIWSRYLGLFVGHSAYAQIIVLVIFLGGMSLGAHLASRWSDRWRAPLLWYAGIEMVVGLVATEFHDVFVATTAWSYTSLFPSLTGVSLTAVKWLVASLLILPQSVLLGATFPLMSAGVIRMARAEESPGRLLSLLYFANSLGAAAGVLLAGLFLIEWVGLPGTLLTAGILNMVAALIVILIARAHRRMLAEESSRLSALGSPLEEARREPSTESREPVPDWIPLLAVAFGTAVASFIYEIAWIRMLALVLGSATHAFELMLSAFILGLALGAFWIRGRADRIADPIRMLGVVQLLMGSLAIGTLLVYSSSFTWMAGLTSAVDENAAGYRLYNLARYGIALAVMLPPTFCAGITLPLITRTLLGAGHGERAIGAVYAWNTLGSILGVALASLWLLPLLGLRVMLIAGGAVDLALGAWLLWHRARREPSTRPTAVVASFV